MVVNYKAIVDAQRKFFKTGITRSVDWRKKQLGKLRQVIDDRTTDLCDAIYKDLRRPKEFTRQAEVGAIIGDIDYALANIDDWIKPSHQADEPFGQALLYKDPLGVVLIIAPFNFPLALALRPLVAAVSAGNTAILKPSEMTVSCSRILAEILNDNFPPEFLLTVEGGIEASQGLLEQRYDHIFYTGSPAVGRVVMEAASKHLTPVSLELGGKSPTYIDVDADLIQTAAALCRGKWTNVGQVCMAPDYVLVHEEIKTPFYEAMKDAAIESITNNPKKSDEFSRIVNQRHSTRLDNLVKNTKGTVIYKSDDPNDIQDHFVGPHFIEVDKDDILLQEEIFGPLLPILPVKGVHEAIEYVNEGEKPLMAYIFTENKDTAEKYVSNVYCGNATVNGCYLSYFSRNLPFGGVGNSGMGRYHGKFGFDTFTHEKAVLKGHPLKAKN